MAKDKVLWQIFCHNKWQLQLIPTIITIPTFILLITLGCWQIQRLNEKNHKIAELSIKTTTLPIALPEDVTANMTALRYRQFTVHGYYLHDKEIFLYAGSRSRYHQDGFLLFTPLRTRDNKLIMINRGWIPTNLKLATSRLSTLTSGLVEVTGYLMLSEPAHWLIPQNNFDKNIWFRVDLNEMQNFVQQDITPYYLMRISDSSEYPICKKLDVNLRNNHLEYAITWFAAALTLLVIFFLYHRDHYKKSTKF